MNRQRLREELAFLLNVTEGTADQDFSTTRLNKALQWVYEDEVRQAKLEGQARWFKKKASIVWSASQVTFKLPKAISQKNIIAFYDITNANPGYLIDVRDSSMDGGQIFWAESDTLQWGSEGPGSETTLMIEYLADAEFLTVDADEPNLIPADYHKLIVWGAGVFLRSVADEAPPQYWVSKHSQMQHDYWKFLSRGRPFTDPPQVTNSATNSTGFFEAAIVAGPGGGLDP